MVSVKFVQRRELAPFATFQPSKNQPVHNWFYFKEAFSPELVRVLLKELELEEPVLDPFCGIGTTLLTCKESGLNSIGFDVNPLAVFASRVKCADYKLLDLKQAADFVLRAKWRKPSWKWRFELFPPSRAFPKGSFEEALFLREKINEISDEKARDFLLLALVSVIPEASWTLKDGGVLKLAKRKRVPPLRQAFERKLLRMLRDVASHAISGPTPVVEEGDARALPLEDESIGGIVTSPPYLNNVDYTKVYGLELSLLFDEQTIKHARARSLHSFISADYKQLENAPVVKTVLKKILEENQRVRESCESSESGAGGVRGLPLVVSAYFSDLLLVLQELFRVLKPGASAGFVVSNAVLPELVVNVDECVGLASEEIGFKVSAWVCGERSARVNARGIPREQLVRESVVVLRKA